MAPDEAAGFEGAGRKEGGRAEPRPGCKRTLGPPGAAALKPGSWSKKYSPHRASSRGGSPGEPRGDFRSERKTEPELGAGAGSDPGERLGSAPPLCRAGIENSRDSHLGVLFSPPTSPPPPPARPRIPSAFLSFPQIAETRKKRGWRRRNAGSPHPPKPAKPGLGGAGFGWGPLPQPRSVPLLPLRRDSHGHGENAA